MDFLRLLSDDLQALRHETKKKYPVVKEAVDRALETLPYLQKQYVALLREAEASSSRPPGPGHPLFQCEPVLRPFLLACNHTNASHKIIILALASIQRLVSWDAIEQSSVSSILRVLQIQAEKNSHVDVQVKLLQTLLQLVTLGYQEKPSTNGSATTTTNANAVAGGPAREESNAMVGNEDLVMQAIWICIHLHGGSSSASSVVGNTAAMTIRQVVSLAFGKVMASAEAKHVGVLVFQELCFMSRDESGVWLKRTATSPMTLALGVELVETILTAHAQLFREDPELHAILKQHICSLVQSAMESACITASDSKHSSFSSTMSAGSGSSSASSILGASTAALSGGHNGSSSSASSLMGAGGSSTLAGGGGSGGTPFFPLLVRVMRLASVALCQFSDVLPDECTVLLMGLLEIVSTGSYYHSGSVKSPSHSKLKRSGTETSKGNFFSNHGLTVNHGHHSSIGGNNGGHSSHNNSFGSAMSSSAGGSGHTNGNNNVSFVTWQVLLALEVLNRLTLEATMIEAIAQYREPVLHAVVRTISAVVTTSPPFDFRLPSSDIVSMVAPRSGLEFLNDQEAPALQPFFSAIRVAIICQSNLVASFFDLSRMAQEEMRNDDSEKGQYAVNDVSALVDVARRSEILADKGVSVVAPYVSHAFNCTMRYSRESELIQLSLKSYHVLATIASRLRANIMSPSEAERSDSNMIAPSSQSASKKMNDVVLSCLRALCVFSFPLPESARSISKPSGNNGGASGAQGFTSSNYTGGASMGSGGNGIMGSSGMGSGPSNEYHTDDGSEEADSAAVTVTWREVHAMKALFSAAHIMEEEMMENEWSVLLEGFEIIVGLSDVKLKGGQNKLPTRTFRVTACRVEDEDVDQQLAMLGNSIIELFRDALNLSSGALRKLTVALRKVCWAQLGLPSPSLANVQEQYSGTSVSTSDSTCAPVSQDQGQLMELPTLSASHQMKTYQNFLGIGLTGSGVYLPTFVFRMLTQLATNSKRCYEDVMNELVAMSTYKLSPSSSGQLQSSSNSGGGVASPQSSSQPQFPQLVQYQIVTTDNILLLMQTALQNAINSSSPRTKRKSNATLDDIQARRRLSESTAHVFDQQELFGPLRTLIRSDMKDRTLTGILELLHRCGHLIHTGWPLLLGAVQESCEVGDAKSQLIAFKCLRLIVDDLLASMPREYVPHCVTCIGRFARCAKDVNISLTAVNELWSVADIIGKQKPPSTTSNAPAPQWGCVLAELSQVALDDRAEVRNCAINTLFGTAVTYGLQFDLAEWQLFMDETVLPLAAKLYQGPQFLSATSSRSGKSGGTHGKGTAIMMHHSRDNAQKQWDESRVLLLTGISRVVHSNCNLLLAHREWFPIVWQKLLQHMASQAERGMSKEVVLATVSTLRTLLQVSSAGDLEQIAQSQPVRAGAGMRVVGGALVAAPSASSANTPTTSATKRSSVPPVVRDPTLWESAFRQLLHLCDDRCAQTRSSREPASNDTASSGSFEWKEDEEQEIGSCVVATLVTLYTQGKEYEFKDTRNVVRMLECIDTLLKRHVLCESPNLKIIGNVSNNSLASRVLNAFEDCGSFEAHPAVHSKALDQLATYVARSAVVKELVFFTRHALMALVKLYASVSREARCDRFAVVLTSIQPCLSSAFMPSKPPQSGAEKAASQQWKHALRILLLLISQGLAAVRLENDHWRSLLDTVTNFLRPTSGHLPACVDGEEDEALVLSILECMVDSVIALFGDGGSPSSRGAVQSETPEQYALFSDALMTLLCSGVEASAHCKPLIKCCVRQLATLGIQKEDERLATLARVYLVRCCNLALNAYAELEEKTRLHKKQEPSDSSESVAAAAAVLSARDRVVILLSSTSEVGMSCRSILEMFQALCRCISCSDVEVRMLVQRLLTSAHLAEVCLPLLDDHVSDREGQRGSGSGSTNSSTRDVNGSSRGSTWSFT